MGFSLILLCAYLLGSVPFGLVITRLAGLGDIRNIGSGNIGATNVLRTGRKDLAAATLLLDCGKGAIAVWITALLVGGAGTPKMLMALVGVAAFIGHCFPVFLLFKGGKGVATFLGTLFAFNFAVAAAACGFWLLTAAITRFSSLSALVAAAATPILMLIKGEFWYFLATAIMAGLIFLRHRTNIIRLLDGEEPKIGQKKRAEDAGRAAHSNAPAVTLPADTDAKPDNA